MSRIIVPSVCALTGAVSSRAVDSPVERRHVDEEVDHPGGYEYHEAFQEARPGAMVERAAVPVAITRVIRPVVRLVFGCSTAWPAA